MQILLGFDRNGNPLYLSLEQLVHHLYVLGKSGMGKTGFLCNICLRLMQNFGIVVVDPVGSLVAAIKTRVPDNRVRDVILFQPSDRDFPFALNPLAPQPTVDEVGERASHIMSVFELVTDEGDWNSQTRQMLRNMLIMLLSRVRGPRGEEFPPALDEISPILSLQIEEPGARFGRGRKTTYRSGLYPDLLAAGHYPVARFWVDYVDKIMTPRPLAEANATLGGVTDQYMSNPLVRNVVGQTQTKLDFLDVMQSGKIVLADLSGIGDDNANFLGSVLMAQLASATSIRKPGSRPFFIVADEISRYGTSAFAEISRKGRNRGVHLIAAQQDQTDMRAWEKGLMGNASNRAYFQLVPSDSKEECYEFDGTPPEAEPEFRARYIPTADYETAADRVVSTVNGASPSAVNVLERLNGSGRVTRRDLEPLTRWYPRFAKLVEEMPTEALAGALADDPVVNNIDFFRGAVRAYGDCLKDEWDDKKPGPFAETVKRVLLHLSTGRVVDRAHPGSYVQERGIYPTTPHSDRTSHSVSITEGPGGQSSGESWGSSDGPESGPLFDKVPGRSRPYSDVHHQIANELTHLPQRHALCKLVGLDDTRPIETEVRTVDLEAENPKWVENWDAIVSRTRQEHCRPVSEVQDEVRTRDGIMRQAVEVWHADEAHRARLYEADGDNLLEGPNKA
jgi:Helicase HerA, central domain